VSGLIDLALDVRNEVANGPQRIDRRRMHLVQGAKAAMTTLLSGVKGESAPAFLAPSRP
jgi:hypothetical protein